MNWDSITFDWNHARAFLATAEEGSLSAAARALGQTQPTLGRQVSALEADLGVLLFERIGKSLVLTQSGNELLEHVRTMSAAAHKVSLAASGQAQAIEGKIRITASDVMSVHILPGAIQHIRKEAPRLQLEIVATNAISDLQQREADIAIRHVRPEEPELIAKYIGEGTGSFYASQQYLQERGVPESFEELSNHDWIGFADNDLMLEYLDQMGIKLSHANFSVNSESSLVGWELARQGLGIIVMTNDITTGINNMVRLFPDKEPLLFPIWLTTHKELHTSKRIRLAFDILSNHLRDSMTLHQPG